MPYIETLDYLNLNTMRGFPIKEGLSRTSTDGLLTVPDDFIADACLSVTSDVSKRFYISKISNAVDNVTVEVSDDDNDLVGTFTMVD